ILEVLSDSSVKKDTETLRESYHRIEIPEYWLIDARGKEILFQILNWKHHGYVAAPSKSGWSSSKVFGYRFRLTRTRDRLGIWLYTLESQREAPKSKPRG